MPFKPLGQFTMRQVLCLFSVLAALLTLTTHLGLLSLPIWLAAVLMWIILSPRPTTKRDDPTCQSID